MGLWSIIKKIKEKEKEMRLLMLGLDNAGKTTIVKKFNGEDIDTISPTLGFNIKTLEYKNYKLNVWDIGGQQTLRSYWRNYFEETDGLIWVVDSADVVRLNDCKRELDKLLQEEKLAGASLLILANKQDLKNALSKDEIAKILDLDVNNNKLMTNRHWHLEKCSAVTGEGLVDGVDWIVEDIASRIFLLE
ncbi:ADP-ribosylation factor-like protein [Acrasis kona]|uniref:ADP-ribosylation factor-like protein 2 n=1 Tax=Acrasis kona TaxID=1008807 RepID=A0AAW2YYM7_9EUKA